MKTVISFVNNNIYSICKNCIHILQFVFIFIAPGEPNNVRINIVDYQTVNISWSSPLLTAGESTMYELKLNYYSKETDKKGEKSVPLKPDQQHRRTYQITSLLPYSDNYISVREAAGDALKWGNFSSPVLFSLPEGGMVFVALEFLIIVLSMLLRIY